ncbi:MAG TPA: serine hydrolase domain-containing protein [Verrucomicrobiae bacterium]|nr:serine hydrolase domain-containing protein [Verrucomicrobiae bacterium]
MIRTFFAFLCLWVFLDRERALADVIDDYITREMTRREVPGLALAVIEGTNVSKLKGYGVADRQSGRPVTAETAFEIGSITKQFTATLILMLREDGKLRLDDRLPRFLAGAPDDWSAITIRHLLTHTSGIRNYTGLDGFEVSRHLTAEQFVRAIGAVPLDFKPGEKFSYCNSGYNLLGFIIEKVTRQSYWDVLRQRIFSPAQMNSSFSRNLPGSVNRAAGYEKKGGQLVARDSNLTDVFAAGAIVSTATDLTKWILALNSEKLVKRSLIEELWKPVKLNDGSAYPYGFGWRLEDYKGRKNIGHSGSTSGFSATLQRFPDQHLTVIVLCNLGEQAVATVIARGVANLRL